MNGIVVAVRTVNISTIGVVVGGLVCKCWSFWKSCCSSYHMFRMVRRRTRNSSYGAILAEFCEHLQVSLVEMILKHSQLDGLKQPYLFGMFRCTTADSFEQTSSQC